jgi:hypothetical protein
MKKCLAQGHTHKTYLQKECFPFFILFILIFSELLHDSPKVVIFISILETIAFPEKGAVETQDSLLAPAGHLGLGWELFGRLTSI